MVYCVDLGIYNWLFVKPVKSCCFSAFIWILFCFHTQLKIKPIGKALSTNLRLFVVAWCGKNRRFPT